MALTGVLGADFSKFTDAVANAELKLRGFESGASKVEDRLAAMGNRFSGQKIIQEASLMAEVFERAGGASAFTAQELAKMNATANEAVAKFQALGKDVPEGIQKIADETKGAAKETSGWSDTVKNLALSFGAMFTARAAMDFVADIAAQAGALSDLSAQTRINVEDLQVMGNAMADFGVTTDQLGRALFKLSNNIANGDDGVADALLNMGLSLKEVQGMKGEELFTTIQAGLAKLDGSLRDTTAVSLYGEKLGMAMAGAAEGTDDAIKAARELNNVMSEDTVQALDAATEAIDKMKGSLSAMAANAIGPVAEGFNRLVETWNKGASPGKVLWAMLQDLGDSWDQGANSTANLTRLMDQQNQTYAASAAGASAAAAAGRENAAATDDQAGATKRLREAEAGLKDFQRITDAAAQQAPLDTAAANEANRKAQEAAENEAKAIRLKQQKLEAGQAWMNHLVDQGRATAAATAAEKAFNEEQERLLNTTKQLGPAHTDAGSQAAAAGAQTVGAYAAVGVQLQMDGEYLREWLNLQRYVAEANAILSSGSSLFTTQSQRERVAGIGGGFPGRAAGGPVSAGEAYVVGEAGPEMFIPGVNGSITPNGSGAGAVINNVFHLVDTESNLARRVGEQIMRQVRAGTQLRTT